MSVGEPFYFIFAYDRVILVSRMHRIGLAIVCVSPQHKVTSFSTEKNHSIETVF
jgi:hypothetical protein